MSILGSILNFSRAAVSLANKAIDAQKSAIGVMIAVPIRAMVDAVTEGKWKGKGADAFKREMEEVVLKQLTSMGGSLDTLNANVNKASSIMENAENQACNLINKLGGLFGDI